MKLLFRVFILSLFLFSSRLDAVTLTIQDKWIDKLRLCESGGKDDITILDTNNKYSYGGLQFQLGTFVNYGKKYGILPMDFTNEESLLLIHSPFVQRAIAREMLEDGLSYHWKNCRDKIGNYPQDNT